jgi:hypothetical protein
MNASSQYAPHRGTFLTVYRKGTLMMVCSADAISPRIYEDGVTRYRTGAGPAQAPAPRWRQLQSAQVDQIDDQTA